jgi:hypothetical protein
MATLLSSLIYKVEPASLRSIEPADSGIDPNVKLFIKKSMTDNKQEPIL